MKLLTVTQDKTGVDYYRLTKPNVYTHEKYDDFEVNFTPSLDSTEEYSYKIREGGYEAVMFNRVLSHTGNTKHVAEQVRKAGAKIILDVDDYWILPEHHLLYNEYKAKDIISQQIEALKVADVVTCSTPYLADKVKEFNDNVNVIRNGIDPNETQWQLNPQEYPATTVAFIGGVHHVKDITSVSNQLRALEHLDENYELIYGGWVDHHHNNKIAHYMGEGQNDKFKKIPALPVNQYGVIYDIIDIAIAPLQKNMFNSCKSELKAIEAGFKKSAFIGSDMYPYKYVCNEKNSILVDHKGWYDAITKLIREPNLREDLTEQLYLDVNEHYHLDKLSEHRYQVYKRLVE